MEANNIVLVSKRQKKAQSALEKEGYLLIDVTSSSESETFRKFSPFYPHGRIPVPGMTEGTLSQSVEGIWQGLKVFEKEGVDVKRFSINNMKNIKRAAGDKRGKVIGHVFDGRLIGYMEAWKAIYVPSYNYVLRHYLQNEILFLKGLLDEGQKIALVDFDFPVNKDSKPLAYAGLIKASVLGLNPEWLRNNHHQEAKDNDNAQGGVLNRTGY